MKTEPLTAAFWKDCKYGPGFHGASGDSCGQCKATINVPIPGAGWICPNCEGYNTLPWSGSRMLFKKPTIGLGKDEIIALLKPDFDRVMGETEREVEALRVKREEDYEILLTISTVFHVDTGHFGLSYRWERIPMTSERV